MCRCLYVSERVIMRVAVCVFERVMCVAVCVVECGIMCVDVCMCLSVL